MMFPRKFIIECFYYVVRRHTLLERDQNGWNKNMKYKHKLFHSREGGKVRELETVVTEDRQTLNNHLIVPILII